MIRNIMVIFKLYLHKMAKFLDTFVAQIEHEKMGHKLWPISYGTHESPPNQFMIFRDGTKE